MKTDDELFEVLDNIDDISISDDEPLERIKRIKHYIESVLDDEEGEEEETEQLEDPNTAEMIITDEQLVTAMKSVVEDMDADELAQLAGDALGGLCWYTEDGLYSFVPDENYCGALDFTKEKEND
jgi:tetrahydromethanopterin S-methyltransferase subunit A